MMKAFYLLGTIFLLCCCPVTHRIAVDVQDPEPVVEADPIKLGIASIPEYDRYDWGRWIDVDKDGQDTRQEVLILESEIPVSWTDENWSKVATGRWLDLYTGDVVTDPGTLDIDHVVALQEAHMAGGWRWTKAQKLVYFNDLDNPGHLIAVGRSVNRSKGARGPTEWLPPDPSFHCEYLKARLVVLNKYQLEYDRDLYLNLVTEKCE